MAETQSRHRIEIETTVVKNNVLMERLGWASATSLGLGTIAGSIWLIHDGHSLEGLAGVVAALGALLGLYIWARNDQVQAVTQKRAADMVLGGATPEQLGLVPPAGEPQA